ncbi:hypothetical protein HDU67_007279 [Dinochytrium kinnereticum]|nr:hypothetical protein HDU67_007279 [Dinochytrium kinnereticum]
MNRPERKPQPPKAKPVRYWPGKAPAAAPEQSSDESGSEAEDLQQKDIRDIPIISSGPSHDPQVLVIESTRLKRLLQNKSDASKGPESAPSSTKKGDAESGDDSEEEMLRRRQRMRENALKRQQMEAEEPPEEIGALKIGSGEESESSEYTTDSDSDDEPRAQLFKPVFIPKETIMEKERLVDENELAEDKKKKAAEQRKLDSHELVAEELRRELAIASVTDGPPDVDDTDGLDEDAEYNSWKLRELLRIKRDREEQDEIEREKAEIERRRNMTDAELIEENERLKPKEEGSKYQFLQKYYHKGAFYSDMEILTRDYNQPTLEDKFDKSILPSVMQVKKFGRVGQTKWTHLTNEDTSIGDSAWFQKSDVNKRILSKMAGMEQSFQKPTKRQRVG